MLTRTLIRVFSVNTLTSTVYLVIPAFNPREIIEIKIQNFPEDLQIKLKSEFRFFAKVDLSVEDTSRLILSEFEY